MLNLDSITCECLHLKYRGNSHTLSKSEVPNLSPLSLPSLILPVGPQELPQWLLETPSAPLSSGRGGHSVPAQGHSAWTLEATGNQASNPQARTSHHRGARLFNQEAAKNPCLIAGQEGVDSSHCG